MRTASGILLSSAAAVGLIALVPARAAAPVVIEKSLLGVRILQTYKDVLAKWGQPRLVLRNNETAIFEPALDPSGNDTGGIKGVSYSGGGASGGGAPNPGMGKGGGGMGGSGLTPMAPGSGGGGPGGGGGGLAGGGASADDADTTFGQTGAYGWIYFDPYTRVARTFMFNLEGRVLFIVERGNKGGSPTQRGLKLGDPIKTLYELYGWPDTIQENEPGYYLDYGSKYHAKFAIIRNRVVGIGVVLEENQPIHFFPESSGGGAGAPGGGMGGGGGKMGGGGRAGGGAAGL